MNTDLIKEKTKAIICRFLRLDSSELNESSTLPELGADNLDQIEIFWSIENEFNILITSPTAESLYASNFNSICQKIEYAISNKQRLFAY